MTVKTSHRLIFFDCFSKRAHLRHPGRANPLDPSADQGSVDRQDHGRESGVSRHARAGPQARRAGAFAHVLPEGKCGVLPVEGLAKSVSIFDVSGIRRLGSDSNRGIPWMRSKFGNEIRLIIWFSLFTDANVRLSALNEGFR